MLSSSHILHPPQRVSEIRITATDKIIESDVRLLRNSTLRPISHVYSWNFARIEIHRPCICHLLTGGKTSDRKIRGRWCCAGNHASGRASSAPQGRVHHSRCLHTGHNNDLLYYMDLVFRPSGQTKGNVF